MGRQHQGMDRPGVRQVPEGSGEQGKIEKTGCEIICGATATLTVKGQMMMMMMMMMIMMKRVYKDQRRGFTYPFYTGAGNDVVVLYRGVVQF